MRIKKMILVPLCLLAMNVASAYDGIGKLFAEEDGELFNSLSLATRYEMLNNYGKSDAKPVTNSLGTTESRIVTMDADHMLVATSVARTVEMKLLHKSRTDTVIAVIETVKSPVADSRISFYDAGWHRLKTSTFIEEPAMSLFFAPHATAEQRANVLSAINFVMISMEFKGNTLVATCHLEDFFLGQDYDKLKDCVRETLVYDIKGAKFKLRK